MAETVRLPLFPLNTVLFPGGLLPLRVFETRYMDMTTRCLRDGSSFGICLIQAGPEVGEAALPELVGTEARIAQWDMSSPGVLEISVRGERRFAIEDHEVERDGLLVGGVRWLPEAPLLPVPEAQAELVGLLREIADDLGERMPGPARFDDAAWVGARFAEMLPIPVRAKQKLLELEDVASRLEIIQAFLRQQGLFRRG